jgi:hypothetical protein
VDDVERPVDEFVGGRGIRESRVRPPPGRCSDGPEVATVSRTAPADTRGPTVDAPHESAAENTDARRSSRLLRDASTMPHYAIAVRAASTLPLHHGR